MSRRAAFGIVLSTALLMSLPARPQALDIDEALKQADAVRTSDPRAFARILGELTAEEARASRGQRELIRYFRDYSLAYGGKFDEAAADLKSLFSGAEDIELRYRAGALIANSYAVTRQYAESLAYLDQTLALLPRVKTPEFRHQGLGVAATLYNLLGQYQLGKQYAEQVLADQSAKKYHCFVSRVVVESAVELGEVGDDDALIDSALERCRADNEPLAVGFLTIDKARRWMLQGREPEALALLESSIDAIRKTAYQRLVVEADAVLADLYLRQGRLDQAEAHALRTVAADQGPVATRPKVAALEVLYRVAQKKADLAAELKWLRLYSEADKDYLNEVKAKELAFQLAKLETVRKNQTIEILAKQNEVLKLQQQVAAQTVRSNQLLVALLVVLLGSLGLWAWRTKRVQISLRRMAEQDALTGVFNRRHFTALAEEKLAAAAAIGKPVCLVMFDLDHFKHINDSFGHPTGDWVLKQVAALCAAQIRRNDLIGRMGGEEFAILLLGCEADSALLLADHCREAVASIDTAESGHAFRITASFGVASARDSGYEFRSLFSHADAALYASKHHGRNSVSLYEDSAAPGAGGAGAGLGDL